MTAIAWFTGLSLADVGRAGGKGANLGELTKAGLPVPPGFVVTADGYLAAMDEGGVRDRLRAADAGSESPEELHELVLKAGLPAGLRVELLDAYHRLGGGPVAVRSSATSEDTAGTSFAGMNRTFTDVEGDEALVEAVVGCWASLFAPRVFAYRAAQGISAEPAGKARVAPSSSSRRST